MKRINQLGFRRFASFMKINLKLVRHCLTKSKRPILQALPEEFQNTISQPLADQSKNMIHQPVVGQNVASMNSEQLNN